MDHMFGLMVLKELSSNRDFLYGKYVCLSTKGNKFQGFSHIKKKLKTILNEKINLVCWFIYSIHNIIQAK